MSEPLQDFIQQVMRKTLSGGQLMEGDIMTYLTEQLMANPHLLNGDVRQIRAHFDRGARCYGDPDKPKCNIRAAALRREGNLLYVAKQFWKAIEKYNESICAAPNGSADLGCGYANRSAVFYVMQEYGLALANIELAKKHQYPEHLMPKLTAREVNCQQKLSETDNAQGLLSEGEKLANMFALNLESNPRIPFLAKNIAFRELPIIGRTMVAKKHFEAGAVILHEKSVKISVGWDQRFTRCNSCLSANLLHLIPCPNCVSVMYCNEQCLQEGHQLHRFECGSSECLSRMFEPWIGPRMFFYGLSLFEDDVERMKEFCRANRATGTRFFDLDYSNYNPLEEFRVFVGTTLKRVTLTEIEKALYNFTAVLFFQMYMKIPLVRSLISTESQKNFMLQCFINFMDITRNLSVQQTFGKGYLYPIASGFRHSCDPNAILLECGNQLRVIVLRPIRRGEQIFISYGPLCDHECWKTLNCRLASPAMNFMCEVCNGTTGKHWMVKHMQTGSINPKQLATVQRVAADGGLAKVDKLDALQQFVQQYGSVHPQQDCARIVWQYRDELIEAFLWSSVIDMRQKVVG